MKTRKQLLQDVQALTARLGAAAGETRKNLRERVARLTAEKAEAEKLVKQVQDEAKGLRQEAADWKYRAEKAEAKIEEASNG